MPNMSILDKFFGPSYEKELKRVQPIVDDINALESEFEVLTDDEIKDRILDYRTKIATGTSLEEVMSMVFALTREASKRTLGLRHYDVQLVGGVLLHGGNVIEMRTGEGKTLMGTLAGSLNALLGKGVHVVTVNDYLSRRDAVWMGQVYNALGLSVGVINHASSFIYDESHVESEEDKLRDTEGAYKVHHEFLRPCTRQEAYQADITYGTNNEFGFDYLRDNIEFDVEKIRQQHYAFAIVDEIDSILIDEARTPLIISAPAADSENLYTTFTGVANKLKLLDT